MQAYQPSVFARDDTFFGVCQALGEDFGFNPTYLRVALCIPLLYAPVTVIAAYAIAGVVVALSRVLFPNPRIPVDANDTVWLHQPAAEPAPRRNDEVEEEMMAVAA